MSLLRLNNDIIVKDVIQTYLNRQGNNDISIKCNNGIIYTNKLVLASWSGFWKDLLIGTGEEKQTIIRQTRRITRRTRTRRRRRRRRRRNITRRSTRARTRATTKNTKASKHNKHNQKNKKKEKNSK